MNLSEIMDVLKECEGYWDSLKPSPEVTGAYLAIGALRLEFENRFRGKEQMNNDKK